MLLLEIAAQGVKGVSPAGGSARLRPGYNVVAFEPAALRRLLDGLFHPDEEPPSAPGAAPARAAVTIAGDDGVTYRVFRDPAAGCQLHRLDPQRRAFALVSEDGAEIARRLAHEVGAPARGRLALLGLSAAELPSRQAAGAAAVALAPRRALGGDRGAERLAELRAELERARRAEKLQFQVDGVQQRIFRADEALREGARLREAVAVAEGAVASLAGLAAAADGLRDPAEKLAAHARAIAKRDEALAKVREEREAMASRVTTGEPPSFWKEPRFWAGAGAGLAAAVAGGVGAAFGGARYLALLDIPAFGWAAWVALGWVSAVEAHGRCDRRGKVLDDVERKILEAFERETADVRTVVAALGLAGVPELAEALEKLAGVRAAAAGARERLEAFEARPEIRMAAEERARAERELAEAERALVAEAGGFVRDPRSVEAEIARVEAELANPAQDDVAADAPAPAVDPFRALGERAAQELGGSVPGALRSVQAKAAQAIQALSANRIGAIAVADGGELSASIGGRPVPVATLPPPDRDLVYVALKLAFLDRAFSGGRAFAVLGDGLGALPEAARRTAARTLKALARSGQLLHATVDPVFRESADHAP